MRPTPYLGNNGKNKLSETSFWKELNENGLIELGQRVWPRSPCPAVVLLSECAADVKKRWPLPLGSTHRGRDLCCNTDSSKTRQTDYQGVLKWTGRCMNTRLNESLLVRTTVNPWRVDFPAEAMTLSRKEGWTCITWVGGREWLPMARENHKAEGEARPAHVRRGQARPCRVFTSWRWLHSIQEEFATCGDLLHTWVGLIAMGSELCQPSPG